MGTEDGWIRLGHEVARRRKKLGLSMAKAAARTREGDRRGFDVQTWSGIERADRHKRRDSVLADLSWALGWTDDSARRILEGRSPVERTEATEIRLTDDEAGLSAKEHRALQALQEASRAVWEMIEERRR